MLVFSTKSGRLYRGDCLKLFPRVKRESVDMIFADPPFNLNKDYGAGVTDKLPRREYVAWTRAWITAAIPCLKPGGSFFIYNLPEWCVVSSALLLARGLPFQNWIAVKAATNSINSNNRLSPLHYGLVYHTKPGGKTFRRIRTPIEACRHCGGDIKDYGGYRASMNPNGVTLSDIWTDVTPVRHAKYKPKARGRTNAISTKIAERCIHMTTNRGGVVLDPFGGTGSTLSAAERAGRKWIGFELGSCDAIIERFNRDIPHHVNLDWVDPT